LLIVNSYGLLHAKEKYVKSMRKVLKTGT